MIKPRVLHLLNDFALGGVTRSLRLFDHPDLRAKADHSIIALTGMGCIPRRYNADIIITHLPPNWARLPLFTAIRLLNPQAKMVHIEHSYSPEWAAHHVTAIRRFAFMLRTSFRIFDTIICVSETQRNWLSGLGQISPSRLMVIPPFSDEPDLSELPIPRFEPGLPLTIGAYGRFHESKGFDRLIRVFQRLDRKANLRLIIGGYGPDEPLLRSLAAGNPAISFLGKVTNVANFMAGVDVVAVPSRYESYGQVANEAKRAGRPLVISKVGSLLEQLGDAGISLDFDDEYAAAQGLQSVSALPLAAMAKAGRLSVSTYVEDRVYAWQSLIQSLLVSSDGFKATPSKIMAGQNK